MRKNYIELIRADLFDALQERADLERALKGVETWVVHLENMLEKLGGLASNADGNEIP